MEQDTAPLSRRVAALILMIGMIASGLAAAAALGGWYQLSLQICGGAIGLAVLVLVIGGVLVSANQGTDDSGGR